MAVFHICKVPFSGRDIYYSISKPSFCLACLDGIIIWFCTLFSIASKSLSAFSAVKRQLLIICFQGLYGLDCFGFMHTMGVTFGDGAFSAIMFKYVFKHVLFGESFD